jgi:BT1 family
MQSPAPVIPPPISCCSSIDRTLRGSAAGWPGRGRHDLRLRLVFLGTIWNIHLADNFQPSSPSLPPPPADASGEHGTSMIGLGTLFGLLYFVQGIVEPTDGLLSQPIKSLLRNWGYSAASTAWFISLLSLAWAIKPLYGLLTDFVPLAGSRRRSYLLLTTAVGIYQLDGGVSSDVREGGATVAPTATISGRDRFF